MLSDPSLPHSQQYCHHQHYLQGEKQDELYLNLVLEYVPETVYSISRHHQKSKIPLPLLYVKLYLYQLSRALSHIHSLGICHRDIKPQVSVYLYCGDNCCIVFGI